MTNKQVLFIDFDGTLMSTVSGETFPKGCWDYKVRTEVLDAIKKMQPKYICIVTNQGGISKGYVNELSFKALLAYVRRVIIDYTSVNNVVSKYCSSNDASNLYRKPNTGMFDNFMQSIPGLQKDACIMVGDASGKPGDFSDSDKKFADNCGIDYADIDDFLASYK